MRLTAVLLSKLGCSPDRTQFCAFFQISPLLLKWLSFFIWNCFFWKDWVLILLYVSIWNVRNVRAKWLKMWSGMPEGLPSVFKHHLVAPFLLVNTCNITFSPLDDISASCPTPLPKYQGSLCLDLVASVVVLAVLNLSLKESYFHSRMVHCNRLPCKQWSSMQYLGWRG